MLTEAYSIFLHTDVKVSHRLSTNLERKLASVTLNLLSIETLGCRGD